MTMSASAQRISSVIRRRWSSQLKTPRSGRPAQAYSAPIMAADRAASPRRRAPVAERSVASDPHSPAVAVAIRTV